MPTQTINSPRNTRRGWRLVQPVRIHLIASSSALQDGAQTACDFPRIFFETIWDLALCLPHKKHDMVAAPKDVAAVNGDPDTLDL